LYEGIDLGNGPIGLITYMRTDSVALAGEAIAELREFIQQRYGKDKIPESPRQYKTKSKNAQEAHEAIRPTSCWRVPEEIRSYLSEEQFRLYQLIWQRTVACQMIHALIDTISVDLAAEPSSFFRATGSTIRDPGFLAVYEEGLDDQKVEKENPLPPLTEGEAIKLKDIEATQHFTEPPPRYSEASLVKMLEEYGIGRPSTYASIISTLQAREYVELDRLRFTPTDIGRIVNKFLTEHFTRYVDYDFTANLEDQLDEISRGEKNWTPVLDEFWQPFSKLVDEKMDNVQRSDVLQARELGLDPKTGKPISVRMGKFGPFVQIGSRDDEDKPIFASLRAGMKMDSVSLEEALELFKLPRALGETTEGQTISASIGRFGPYLRYGSNFVSLKKEDDPYTVTLERALALIEEKKASDLAKIIKDFGDGIQILKGRWGPFLASGKIKAKIPKDKTPETLSLEEAQALIAEATPAKKETKKASKKTTEANADTSAETEAQPATAAAKKKAAPKKTSASETAKTKAPAKKSAASPTTSKTSGTTDKTPRKKTGT
jgi:DNA topoisomerase-1